MDWKGKVAVISGAGSGIGRALALDLAGRGARLALNDVRADRLEETASLVARGGTEVLGRMLDVSDRAAVSAFAEGVQQRFGQVDGVFNNAGVALGRLRADRVTPEDWAFILGVNLHGVIHGCEAFLPLLARRPRAVLVNLSSLFGLVGVPFQVPYCTTKFAVRGYTEALRAETALWCPQVRVHAVHPGGIKTRIARDARGWSGSEEERRRDVERFERMFITEPERAAAIILRGVARGRGRILVGPDTRLPDLLARLAPGPYPGLLARWARRKMPGKA